MDIVLLRTFLEVARTRHFGKAAAQLCVTQSAVSARIKLLETTLGTGLFQRRRNDIQLTAAGERLLRHADAIVRLWSQARQELAPNGDGAHPLAVGCEPDLWPIRVRDWAARMRRERADLALQIELHPPETLAQRLACDQLDLALLLDPPIGQDLELTPLGTLALRLVADRPDLSPDQALAQGYVQVDWGTAFNAEHSARFPQAPAAALRLSQGTAALDLLERAGGAAYLPEALVREALRAGRLFAVAQAPVMEGRIYAALRPGSPGRSRLREALDALREEDP